MPVQFLLGSVRKLTPAGLSSHKSTVPIKNGFNLTAVIAGVQEQTEQVPSVLLVFRRNPCLTFSVHYTTLQPAH